MFEIKTLIFFNMVVSLSFAVLQLLDLGWTRKLAARDNILTNFLHFFGFSLILSQTYLNNFWTNVFANQVVFISYLFLIKTTFSLFNLSFSKRVSAYFAAIVFLIFLVIWFFVRENVPVNTFLIIIILLVILYAALRLLASFVYDFNKLHMAFIILFLFMAAIYFVRGYNMVAGKTHSVGFLEDDSINTLHVVSLSFFIFIWNYSTQLKRNAIVRKGLEENVTELCDANEDISILNSLLYKGEVKNMKDLYEEIFDLLKNRFAIDKSVIYLFDTEFNTLKVAALRGVSSSSELSVINSASSQNQTISFDSFINQEIRSIDVEDLPFGVLKDVLEEHKIVKLVSYPLTYSGNCLGVLTLGLRQNSLVVGNQIFYSICKQLSGVIYNSQVYDELLKTQVKLKEMATTDHLTGIMNRREFLARYENEFLKSQRHGDSFTLFMVDLDNFKSINDSFGHDAGDVVLVSVVNCIVKQLRSSDLFARYGGEEFVGLLARSDVEGADIKLKRIVEEVSKLVIPGYPEINITISVGTCVYTKVARQSSELIKRADIALYKAKKTGKNKVCKSEIFST